jgi:lysozyme family protein
MAATDDARNTIDAAIDALRTRRAATSDQAEKDAINDQIDHLEAQRDALDEDDLAGSARAVADATAVLHDSVKAAQAGPFDSHLLAMHNAITGLQSAQADMTSPDRLARTDTDPAPPPLAAPPPQQAGLPPVGPGHDFAALAAEYRACFDACAPSAAQAGTVQWCCDHVAKSPDIYTGVGADPNIRVPWYFVGVIHGMEGGFNFGTHLHNGDPLSARTVHVPAGRPPNGNPPFGWAVSARDALTLEGFANQPDWTMPRVLYRLEAYNGFGYRNRGLRTPYLWSFSALYTRGKFVGDGLFDPEAVSKQCGAAVMIKRLLTMGALQLQGDGTLA